MWAACTIEYILLFINLLILIVFSTIKLCCRKKHDQLEPRIKAFIVLPLLTTLFTASAAVYYLVTNIGENVCIYYGSVIGIIAIDLDN